MFIVKVPQVNSKDEKGCERSGEQIIKELRKIAANESGNEIDVDSLELEEIHLDNSDLKSSHDLIYQNSLEIFELKPKTVFLGGDHSITYSLGKAFLEHCKNSETEPCLIVFDSHPDCDSTDSIQSLQLTTSFAKNSKNLFPPARSPTPSASAKSYLEAALNTKTPMEKNKKFPTNTEWLRKLIEEGFPSENILIVGMRNSTRNENVFLKENKIKIMKMNAITEDLHEACDTIMEFSRGKELYVSIDVSVLDPSFAPASHYSEPGGLCSREFLYMIQRINKIKNLRAIDVVEINEKKDRDKMTTKLAAKIVSEIL